MTIPPPRVVFDCNIFVQIALNPSGSAGQCKELIERGEISLFVSTTVLAEVADVLSRPIFRKLAPDLTLERVEAFVCEIAALSIPISNVPEEFHYQRDPEDAPYINLAVVTDAKYLVSLDRDLLDLMDTMSEEGRQFQRRYPLLKILKPADLLSEVMRQREESSIHKD